MDEDIYFIVGELYVKYRKQLAVVERVMKQNEDLQQEIFQFKQKPEDKRVGND